MRITKCISFVKWYDLVVLRSDQSLLFNQKANGPVCAEHCIKRILIHAATANSTSVLPVFEWISCCHH